MTEDKFSERLLGADKEEFERPYSRPTGADGSGLSQNRILGLVATGLLVIGCFSPFIRAPIVGSINVLQNGNPLGVVMLLITLFYALACLKGLGSPALFAAVTVTVFVIGHVAWGLQRLDEIRNNMNGSPLGLALVNATGLDWGVGALGLGSLLAIVAAVRIRHDEWS